jgi:fucokinase
VLAAVWTAVGASYTRLGLVHAVLVVEQLLTTGGGWQDQVGGLHPGLSMGSSPADHRVRVSVELLPASEPLLRNLESRLLLLYTGKPRLAKNLLQNVIRNWYGRDGWLVETFASDLELAGECWEAAGRHDVAALGACLARYWRLKAALAPGSEPALVTALLAALRPWVSGASLAGAGGGGFLVAILREPKDRAAAEAAVRAVPGSERVTFHAATVDRQGLAVTVGGSQVEVPL